MPKTLAELSSHRLVHYAGTLGARPIGFEREDGPAIPMTGSVTVNNADAYQAACLAGLGLIQAPAAGLGELLARGLLVEVLPQHPAPAMPLNLVYANRRHLSRRVRVVMDWLADVISQHLQGASSLPPAPPPPARSRSARSARAR